MNAEDKKFLALNKVLEEMNLPRAQLESSLIVMLDVFYKGDEKKVLAHLEFMNLQK